MPSPTVLSVLLSGLSCASCVGRAETEAAAYRAIVGGALGNILDRLRFGGVTDFLDFYVGADHWPAFNMADVFVVSGAALLILDGWRGGIRRPTAS